ncbi:MAG: anaerobic selenocysteine-containing dehydrogenase [Nitriliruptoraceae bacterium]|jgi:anaerobic selenocysteine-containing dehydrogenase
MTQTTTAQRLCPLCEATCSLTLTLQDGIVTRVEGDADAPFSKGYICPKGATFGELAQDPDRLTSPMIRTQSGWTEVSFDEAFAFIATRLAAVTDAYGNGAVGTYLGNPNVHTAAGQLYLKPLIKSLRSKHVYSASTVDQMPKHVSAGLMFGSAGAIPVPDLDRTDHILLLGANPRMSNGSLLTAPDMPGRLDALRKRGGRLVVVDPRRTRTAAKADQHVAIRPGTDALLLAAIVTTLAEEGLVAMGSLARHVDGVEDVLAALEPCTPEAVASATRVDAEVIRGMARDLATATHPVVYGRIGTHAQRFGTLCAWLVDVINVLIGALDAPGGAMWPQPGHEVGKRPTPYTTGRWHSRVRGLPECNGELPCSTIAEEIETPGAGQLRAMFVVAGNPVRSTPNQARLEAALQQLDLLVCVDPYLTATSRHADVILPPPSPLCEPHPEMAFASLSVRNVTHYSAPVLPLPDGAMHEWQILLTLAAIALGGTLPVDLAQADAFVARQVAELMTSSEGSRLSHLDADAAMTLTAALRGPARLVDLMWRAGPYGAGDGTDGLSLAHMLDHPSGVDHGALLPRLPDVLTTSTGRVVLAPLQMLDDVPRLLAAMAAPEDGLLLVGRRHLRTNNSWGQNVPGLAGRKDLSALHVHPEDAATAGLTEGGQAVVQSRVGSVTVRVELTEDLAVGTVSLPHGFGNDEDGIVLTVAAKAGGVNSNVLTDEQDVDPLSGNAVLNGIPVTLTSAL